MLSLVFFFVLYLKSRLSKFGCRLCDPHASVFVLLQVRATREGCSTDLYPPAEDRTFPDPTPWGCWKIWHGDSSGGWDGCQPQSTR